VKKYLVFLILILIISFLIFGIYLPRNPFSAKEITFNIKKGDGSREIALNLEKEGLIRWSSLFRVYVLTAGVSGKLQAGTYLFSPSMNIPGIAKKMVLGDTLKIKVTIPEGFNLKQIEAELTSKLQRTVLCRFTAEEFKGEFGFLKDIPDAASLEGFLFPDTYFFSPEIAEKEIVITFLKNFDKKLTPDLREEIERQKKTIFEIIKTASLIEKEVKTEKDKKLVAGILWKRLNNGIPLQVDATISYITGKQTIKISKTDLQTDSPYNTYKYQGLPLGPISNPGIVSILAAIYPEDSESWYYLSAPDGETIFSKTLKDHNTAKAQYLK